MENNKLTFYARIGVWLLGALLGAVCAVSIILVPKTLHTLDRVNASLERVDSLVETANTALITATEAAENANKLVADNADSVSEAMEKFNSVDFDALNRAINDLADIVEPLAKVSNFFK